MPAPTLTAPSSLTGLVCAIAGTVLFSAKAIVVKLSYRYGVDAVTVLALRMLLSVPFFLAAVAWSLRPGAGHIPLTRRDAGQILLLGVSGYYLASLLDFLGLQYISAGLERLILFLYPTMVILAQALLHRRRVGRDQMLALAVSYAGIALVFAHDIHWGGGHVTLGALLVLGAAASYAWYLVSSGQMVRRVGAMRLTALATSVAAVLCGLQFVASHPIGALANLPAPVWQLGWFNAVFCTVVPVFATMLAIARIGAARVSIAGMVGPAATLFMGAALLDEPINAWQICGTLLVLTGVYLTTRGRGSIASGTADPSAGTPPPVEATALAGDTGATALASRSGH